MPVISNIEDLRVLAQKRVPRIFYDYVDTGSWTESTYHANCSDLAAIKLRQRVGINVEHRSMATGMAGQACAMPVALAPTGLTGMIHADGEILAGKLRWCRGMLGTRRRGFGNIVGHVDGVTDAAALGGSTEIHMDGGIRSGQDVLRALALGAQGVYVGRPFLYGLGAMGRRA
jgi:isopentenyl diphosphate isomerase/L-lactate dehydrogenase-like FMN-dependent dehydrogenase